LSPSADRAGLSASSDQRSDRRSSERSCGRVALDHLELLQGVLMPAPGGPEEVEDRDAHAFLWGLGRVLAPEAQEVMGAAVTAAA